MIAVLSARLARKRTSTARLQELEPDLLAKVVRRHRGKWVAIADGTVVAADRSSGSVRRAARGAKRPDASMYWVPG